MREQERKGKLFSNQALWWLIAPLVVEQILAVTVGMVDTVMVSSAGEAATSGVSLVDMINTLIINIFAAVATGGAVVSSQYLGQKDKGKACQAADQLLLITALIAVGMMLLCLIFRRSFLSILYGDIEADVMQNALTYLILSAFSYPFLAVYNSCAALFRSMGNSRISMQVSILMNVMNAVGDYVFIFGFHWGVAGAALASLISRMTACVILYLRLRNPALDIHAGTNGLHLDGRMIHRILNIGIPSGVENSIFQLGRVLVVGIIASFGTIQIAANAVANNLDSMGVLPGSAMNLAMITVIGQCVGAGDYDQAKYYTKKLMTVTYAVNTVTCLAVLGAMPMILKLYGLSDETLALASTLVLIHDGCAIFLWPASFTLTSVLRAANDVKFPMVISIGSMIIFRIGLSYVVAVGMGLGAIGVWIAMVVDWIVRASCFIWRYRSGKWKIYYRAE